MILQASSTKPDKTALGGRCFELQFKAIEFPWLHLVCSPSETQVKRCCQEASPGKERKVVQGDRLRSTPEDEGPHELLLLESSLIPEVDIFQESRLQGNALVILQC